MRPEFTPEFIERFWSRVDRSGGQDACWIWLGSRDKRNYGTIRIQTKGHKAHRVAYAIRFGDYPTPCGLHKCDNPPCCNPDHISAGTKHRNAVDREHRGRGRWDENPEAGLPVERWLVGIARGKGRHGLARFTDDEIRRIRAERTLGATLKDLASRHQSNTSTIWSIVSRETYRHVD